MSKKEPRWYDISLSSDPSVVGKYRVIPGKAPLVEVTYCATYKTTQYDGSPIPTARMLLSELYQEEQNRDG